ncbi:MAG: PIN domain-containing protein [Janthinobacterium lividum]
MPTRLVVLDTNILVAISKRQFDPRILNLNYSRVLVSFVAHTEALGFNFPDLTEERRMQALLDGLEKVPFGEAEAHYAIIYRKLRKIKFPDAAILATARAAGADLLTQNTKDFVDLDPAVRVLTIQDL